MQSYIKATISNNFVEVKQQANPPLPCPTSKGGRRRICYQSSEEYESNLKVSINRARKMIRRLLECNFTDQYAFITLTFKSSDEIDITSIETCNKMYAKFKKRLSYYLAINNLPNFKYLGVTEFHDKNRQGAVHFHLVSNLTEITSNKLQELWEYGLVDKTNVIAAATDNEKIAYYLKKGITDPRLNGHKRYFHSHGLKQPIILEVNNPTEFYDYLNLCKPTLKFGEVFHSPYNGETKYEEYYLTDSKELMKYVQDLQ